MFNVFIAFIITAALYIAPLQGNLLWSKEVISLVKSKSVVQES